MRNSCIGFFRKPKTTEQHPQEHVAALAKYSVNDKSAGEGEAFMKKKKLTFVNPHIGMLSPHSP